MTTLAQAVDAAPHVHVAAEASCAHCGAALPSGAGRFCCPGCAAAYDLIHALGFDQFYRRRLLEAGARPLRPEAEAAVDYAPYVVANDDGTSTLHLMVDGLNCAACVWLIESVLAREPSLLQGRVNMTSRRLTLRWRGASDRAAHYAGLVASLGFRVVPFDPQRLAAARDEGARDLLRAMAVAGFAASNVMLLSVSVWAGHGEGMGQATRDLMHWVSALIAMPAIAYAGRPFFRSALAALKAGRTNMDVPISIGVLLATGMSLFETAMSGTHAYFDSAITLLFFLLVGRYLDRQARGRARATVEHLLSLNAMAVTLVRPDGSTLLKPPGAVAAGDVALIAAGERIPVDGQVISGRSDLDTGLVTGESVPQPALPGTGVFAGMINLTAPLRVRVTATGERTLLADIVRLMEAAEQGRARFVALADRVARLYAPVVHILAASAFVAWYALGIGWQPALLNAVAVLIITCPCALALAVPVVQVVASGRLLRQGILLKSATALERLAEIDTVVFDKTGTLTLSRLDLLADPARSDDELRLAASLAQASRHPLARALVRVCPEAPVRADVVEHPGQGLSAGNIRLGSAAFVGVTAMRGDPHPPHLAASRLDPAGGRRGLKPSPACGRRQLTSGKGEGLSVSPELWLARAGAPPVRFVFADRLRPDAAEIVGRLRAAGLRVELLSGDREDVVQAAAAATGIETWHAACDPAAKCARLRALQKSGRRVLMVGDGLNDAPALASAHVSLSPATAADVSQTAADAVFQGDLLRPVVEILSVARGSERLVRQNLALALLYNLGAVPLALLGYVTPLIAAAAMSTSSLLVIGNALRLARGGRGRA